MPRITNPHSAAEKAARAIDRDRERERRFMLQNCYKHADDLATKLVQRLMDKRIIETTSESDLRTAFTTLLTKMSDMEEFDMQFKIAPLRTLVQNPSFVSLYITQYIVEDLIEHPKVNDVFGDDLEIYQAVESVMKQVRPPE